MKIETTVFGNLADINPIFFGYNNEVDINERSLVINRKNCFIHFVKSGKGYFTRDGITYTVGEGDAFVICYGNDANYYSDEKDPYKISWVCFDGNLSYDFAKLPPVFKADPKVFEEIDSVHTAKKRKDILLSSILMHWYYELFEEDEIGKNDRVSIVKSYIKSNYMLPLKIEQLASELHLHRAHLLRIFKESTGKTLQEYLISIRIKEAKKMLSEGKNVTETAYACGFSNPSHFSSTFKKHCNISPKDFKHMI